MRPKVLALLLLFAPTAARGAQGRDACVGDIHRCPENFYPRPAIPKTPEARERLRAAEAAALSADWAYKAEILAIKYRESKADALRKALMKYAPSVDKEDVIKARDAYAESVKELRRAEAHFAVKADEAIAAVTAAYGLRPGLIQLPETDPLRAGRQAWAPRFSRDEVRDPVSHQWRQRTGDELRAETAANAERAAKLGMRTEADEAKARYLNWRDVPDEWLQGAVPIEREVASWSLPEPEPLRLDGDRFAADLGAIQSTARGLREAAETAFGERQRVREEAQRAQDERLRSIRRAREEAEEASWVYLVAMTNLACNDPEALGAQVRAGNVVGTNLGSIHLMRFRDQAQSATGWGSIGKRLGPCQEALIARIINNRGPAAVYLLLDWAEQYRAAHPTLGERVGNALDEFFGALTRVAPETPAPQSPLPSVGGSPEPPRQPRERSRAGDGERRGVYVPPCLQEEGRRCIRW
jgi:hypothetical protein